MKQVVIERFEFSDQGTFGRLITDGLQLFTGELPWRENKTSISCLPVGEYECEWTYSETLERSTYEVKEDFEDRSGIRIHPANFFGDKSKGFRADVEGCISLGECLGFIEGQRAILLSKRAVEKFEKLMRRDSFWLRVVERL